MESYNWVFLLANDQVVRLLINIYHYPWKSATWVVQVCTAFSVSFKIETEGLNPWSLDGLYKKNHIYIVK